jgi:hypothetical protein
MLEHAMHRVLTRRGYTGKVGAILHIPPRAWFTA